jgi:hypothetical protein
MAACMPTLRRLHVAVMACSLSLSPLASLSLAG